MSQPVVFPSEVRRTLLAEHNELRTRLKIVESLARELLAGEPVHPELVHEIDELRRSLQAHNATEELHLEPLLRGADAWGSIRVEQMLHEHLDEHLEFRSILGLTDLQALAKALPALATKLRAHMKHEEKTFLNRDVLKDDLITLGPTS